MMETQILPVALDGKVMCITCAHWATDEHCSPGMLELGFGRCQKMGLPVYRYVAVYFSGVWPRDCQSYLAAPIALPDGGADVAALG